MPATLSYPGVYIEEVPSGVHTITGVATSITAFIGRAWKGPLNEPVTITSLADYVRKFGGLWRKSTVSYAVEQFFTNGGNQGIIVRVATSAAKAATIDIGGGTKLKASSEGSWGMNLVVTIDHNVDPDLASTDPKLFNITILDDPDETKDDENRGGSGLSETFLNVSTTADSPRHVSKVLDQQSQLVRVSPPGNAIATLGTKTPAANSGKDGGEITLTEIEGDPNNKTGIYALKKADLFNLLCIPPLTPGETGNDVKLSSWTTAASYCEERRALLIVDAPNNWTVANVETASVKLSDFSAIVRKNAAIYFPRLKLADPLQDGNLEFFAPCGVVAGLMSRIDSSRGVWKAPAGLEANLRGVMEVSINMTDNENGLLNPLGINCLRDFPGIGKVCWGARTMQGQDIMASEWKYVPIRRLALFIEESLYRGTKWVVFEPNDEPLWAKIRMNVGAFMMRLFRQGAFQGTTPDKAFYVKCDQDTTTQADRNLGIVNIEVGFAPLKPAEFVVIKIQQIAGEL